jgi:23S rRNA pseudouridine2605 synthase
MVRARKSQPRSQPKSQPKSQRHKPVSQSQGERLQKILARAGLGSRRSCEQIILEGRVAVDGRRVTELGTRADPDSSRITVDGKPIHQERLVYYVVNKPRGIISTMESDAEGRRVVDLVPARVRVYPVGRLEVESEGLMLLTNDGALTHQLTHPSFGVRRVYRAEVDGNISPEALERLRRGVFLAEGKTSPAEVKTVGSGKNGGTLEIAVHEGLNREIRRMLVAVGLKPRRIVRTKLDGLSLGDLPTGAYRVLGRPEVNRIRRATAKASSAPPPWIVRTKVRRSSGAKESAPLKQKRPGGAARARRIIT